MLIIVGGSGFIGRHLRALLAAKGESGVIVSRDPGLARLWSFPGEVFVDACDFNGEQGSDLVAQAKALVYLSTVSTPATFIDAPWKEIRQNVEPSVELILKFATINPKAKRVLISSGGTIYGNTRQAGLVDEEQAAAPISSYGLSKLMIEEALRFAGRSYGVSYNILRLSNAVGIHHRNKSQGVIAAAIRCLHSGEPFELIGDGSTVRDFIDADDVADAIWHACNDNKFNDRIWNVGSGVGTSVLQALAIVERVSGLRLQIMRSPQRSLDVKRIVLDCGRIKDELGWKATHGIAETIEKLWLSKSFT